jgi:voltage-gated potassium channel
MIQVLKDHFIVAGYGRVGREVASGLRQEANAFVVVEYDSANIEKAQADGALVIEGNATEDDILLQAGIERAKGIICATGSDATNIYIILTARGLKADLFVIARASDENSEAKMLRAGADRVISPYVLSGRRMANLAVRPYVVDFLDVTGTTDKIEKTLEEIVVEAGSIIENRTISQAAFSSRTGALILALYRSTGELLTSPHPETLLEAGTRMIVLGTRDALDVTEALARNFAQLTTSESR